MEVSVLINVHKNEPILADTIESIKFNLTNNILLNVEGSCEEDFNYQDVHKIKGFIHRNFKSPHKNMALGLWKCYQIWQNSDWYAYIEPDCLICSNKILERLENNNSWILGNNLRLNKLSDKNIFNNGTFTFLEKLIGLKPKDEIFYLLGCCLFFKNTFLKKLIDLDFFNKFLFYGNFYEGDYPGYIAYDISEHLYPTLAYNFGGAIDELGNCEGVKPNEEFYKYFMRWRPEVLESELDYKNSNIIHPIKDINNSIRSHYQKLRFSSTLYTPH